MILGVRLDEVNREQAIELARCFLSGGGPASPAGRQYTIFTPNPEMLVAAQKDGYFRNVLNSGSLNICDGRGIELLAKKKLVRIPGIDFFLDLCAFAARENRSVYLLGSGDTSVIIDAAAELRRQFPGLHITGFHPGPRMTNGEWSDTTPPSYDSAENNAIMAEINATHPDILFVAFGHGKQEKWIAENLRKMPSVKIAMGVGGAFDLLGGKVGRAPLFLRRLGLEWLWRLMHEPRRIGRIWNATVKFLYLFLTQK